ncbi:hypothetical protein AB4584_24465 [Vibrio splendidus]
MFVRLVGIQMARHLYLISKFMVEMSVQQEVIQMEPLQFHGMK